MKQTTRFTLWLVFIGMIASGLNMLLPASYEPLIDSVFAFLFALGIMVSL
jgi:hypothetical protein